jgi:hypothetical protein
MKKRKNIVKDNALLLFVTALSRRWRGGQVDGAPPNRWGMGVHVPGKKS